MQFSQHGKSKFFVFFLLLLVLLVECIFLTNFYGLYFNPQLHITSNNFFKFLFMLRVLVFIAYQPYARAQNTYWNYIFVFKFKQISYLFSLKIFCPCQDLNPGPPRNQTDMLPIELSWLG